MQLIFLKWNLKITEKSSETCSLMNKNKNFNEEASEEYCLCGVVIVWGGEEFPNQVRKYSLIIRQRDKDIQHTSVINEFRGRRGGKTQEWVGAPSAQKRQRKECKEMNDTEVRSISRPKFFREDFARKLSLQKRDAESVLQQDLARWHPNCPSGHQHDSPSPPLSLRGGGAVATVYGHVFPPFSGWVWMWRVLPLARKDIDSGWV